ncbi:unnamed protein product [Psylliodes chrysocephalus]|uniref:Uncharacterized protein n=1 Tax=Psylliodes chrysocephalus TaxID=3402493 RepID=A0A9P0CM45_9CUCU|nr:unnamed protein product [Psylliodes chrysocephala]
MKYPYVSQSTTMAVNNGTHVDDVDPLFISSCWNSNSDIQPEYIDAHKLILGGHIGNLESDKLLLDSSLHDDEEIESKSNMEALDNLLINTGLAELKPLPPFTGYTANLSINGIQGHHYHTISQRNPEENNNNYSNFNEQNIVSSSTCNISADSAGDQDSKAFFSSDSYTDCVNPDSASSLKYEDCSQHAVNIKTEVADYDISSIDDIAAIIGTAIADTTVPNNNPDREGPTGSRDSWMDLDAWIDGACVDQQKELIITQDGLSEFVIPSVQPQQTGSTLQTILTHGYMPNRMQIKAEAHSSTNYGNIATAIQNIRNNIDTLIHEEWQSQDPQELNLNNNTQSSPSTSKKRRFVENEDPIPNLRICKEIFDTMLEQVNESFSFTTHLTVASLFDSEKF